MIENILQFLKERKRGAYKMLVSHYKEKTEGYSIARALDFIKEDLKNELAENNITLLYMPFRRQYIQVYPDAGYPSKKTEGKKIYSGYHY